MMFDGQLTKPTQYFWWLGLLQVAHSGEETYTELYLKLNAMIVSLHQSIPWFPLIEISANIFSILNYGIIALLLGAIPFVELNKRLGSVWIWIWAVVELLNGAFHIGAWMVLHTYFPGGISGPIMFVLSLVLIRSLRSATSQTIQVSSIS